MSFPKFRKKELSLNHAKMTPEEIQQLQVREGIIRAKQMDLQRIQTELAMLNDSDRMYKQELMETHKLRKKKKYVFNAGQGYIHRPGQKPWESKKNEKLDEIKDPEGLLESAKDTIVEQVRKDQEEHAINGKETAEKEGAAA